MHALVVVSHPDPKSLTHAVARAYAEGVAASGDHSTEIADLAAEGFQPAFGQADATAYLLQAPLPADVLREQQRIDRADALVLVYPVYWWSFPGQLKGWIDRVFSNGWAYDERPDGSLGKRLGHLPIHLIGIGGADGGPMRGTATTRRCARRSTTASSISAARRCAPRSSWSM